ncbi:MAG: Hsp70 family protein [Gammaproteobacteria bacterium]|nr:Hsp70 family protein [Gammaproteobacteria bacterium]MBT6890411.1 Hsp70 family protein [Gammaproteobacteria bacterium]
MVGVGLDFGTSNSAAAWYDGAKVRMVPLEESDAIMPTATHLDRELITLTGEVAVARYIDENRDRIVELTPEVIAKASMVTSEANSADPHSNAETETSSVYGQPWVDRGMPGRLFRGVKRLLGNSSIRRLLVFDHPFRLVALITPILLRIRQAIEESLGEPLADIHFGHPVLFEGNENLRNNLALDRLSEACGHAGISELTFYPEPVAATLSYRHDEQSPDSGCVLTVDFGGGTLDLSVVEYSGTSFDVLSTSGISLGGDHIDQLIFRELLFPHFGKGETWSRVKDGRLIENDFPFEEYEDKLLNWAVTYILNQNQYRSKIIDRIAQGGQGKEKFERLLELITHNFSYLVFQSIKDAKAALSNVEETVIDVPELDLAVPFSRDQFEQIMTDVLGRIETVTEEVLQRSGKGRADIDIVIRTGGSSQIAAVKRLLEKQFPGKVTEHDPFTSVAAGLAIASYYGYQFQQS